MHQSILGTQEFVKWVKEKLPLKESREVPAARSLQRNLTVDQVANAVSQFYGVEAADILDHRTRARRVRQMAMELCYRFCNLGQRQIGQIFNVDYSTVSANRSRLQSRLKSDRRSRKQFDQIREKIINLSN
jgi:putative transposase